MSQHMVINIHKIPYSSAYLHDPMPNHTHVHTILIDTNTILLRTHKYCALVTVYIAAATVKVSKD